MSNQELCALIGFYQDEKAGSRLLQNLEQLGIDSLWVDSRLDGFHQYNNSDVSTDGLPKLIEDAKHAKLYRLGLTFPGEAMNFLLREASLQGYSYTISLGCDEWLDGDTNLFVNNLKAIPMKEPTKLRIPLVEHNFGGTNTGGHITERIVYMPEYVHLKNVHWVYFHNYYGYDKPMADQERTSPLVLGLTVHHDDTIRDPARNKLMDEFQVQQRKSEKDAVLHMIKAKEV